MKFDLSSIFDLLTFKSTVKLSRDELTRVVGSLMRTAKTNSDSIAFGWEELAEWQRISFVFDHDKGQDFYFLQKSLQNIADKIRSTADEDELINIYTQDLAILARSAYQLEQTSKYLVRHETYKGDMAERYYPEIPTHRFAPMFTKGNRSELSYDIASVNVSNAYKYILELCKTHNIKPAGSFAAGNYETPQNRAAQPYQTLETVIERNQVRL